MAVQLEVVLVVEEHLHETLLSFYILKELRSASAKTYILNAYSRLALH